MIFVKVVYKQHMHVLCSTTVLLVHLMFTHNINNCNAVNVHPVYYNNRD